MNIPERKLPVNESSCAFKILNDVDVRRNNVINAANVFIISKLKSNLRVFSTKCSLFALSFHLIIPIMLNAFFVHSLVSLYDKIICFYFPIINLITLLIFFHALTLRFTFYFFLSRSINPRNKSKTAEEKSFMWM